MTKDEILKLEAGEKTDALVDTLVLNRVVCRCRLDDTLHYLNDTKTCRVCNRSIAKARSTDIAAAWEVVEKIIEITELDIFSLGGQWFCDLRKRDNCKTFGGPSAPLAICRAALLSIEGE